MARTEKDRDAEFKQCIKEIREFSVVLYYLVRKATFRWNTKGTAFVTARKGCIHFECNLNFWDRLNDEERLFLILHECYHVFLDHFFRFPKITTIANKAMDLAVNHSLLNHFSFERKKMPLLSAIGCWVDTVIPGKVLLDTLSAEEYLYALEQAEEEKADGDDSGEEGGSGDSLEKNEKKAKENGSMDDHSEVDAEGLKEVLKDILEDLPEELEDKEGMDKEEAKDAIDDFVKQLGQDIADELKAAGSGSFEDSRPLDYKKKRKSTWFQFAKRLVKRFKGDKENTVWLPDKRIQHLAQDNMFLPSYKEAENRNGKILIILFLDTSISCDHLRPHFFGFAKALPKEVFEVVAFGFTTKSYPLNLNQPRFNSGGTSFHDFDIRFSSFGEREKYGFVFTDGRAAPVTLTEPHRWHWFLDRKPCERNTQAIPKECQVHWLDDFE